MTEPTKPQGSGEHLDDLIKVFTQSSLGVVYRQGLIRQLEQKTRTRAVLYVANIRHPASSMNLQDAVLLENVLKQTQPIENLDLMVNSPGGQGEAADKILHICRQFCANGRLRLIVPHFAKSAATMLAFGVDEVVMGPYSELGPTDAQVKIVEGGVEHYVSAQVFVDLLDGLERKIRDEEQDNQGVVSQALLVQLASLNKPFVEHCRRLQWYALDFAQRWMCRYVLREAHQKDADAAKERAFQTGQAFLHSGVFSHGQMLTAGDLKAQGNIHIKINELGRDDPVWRLIWQIHCVCDVLFDDVCDQPDLAVPLVGRLRLGQGGHVSEIGILSLQFPQLFRIEEVLFRSCPEKICRLSPHPVFREAQEY